jgi:circadian clock protein KaiC
MESIGIDLGRWVSRGLLRFHPARPHLFGWETHLAIMHQQIADFAPQFVALDPVTSLIEIGNQSETESMLTRLIDFLKVHRITGLFTSLTPNSNEPEMTQVGISSLMDTWLLLRNLESNGERNRGLYVLKSRGMAHSNQIREFLLTDSGAKLLDVYTGPAGMLTGTARMVQEQRDKAQAQALHDELNRKRRELDSKREAMEAQITALRAKFASEASELEAAIAEGQRTAGALADQHVMLRTARENQSQKASASGRKESVPTRRQQEAGGNNGRRKGRARAGK